MNIFTRPIYMHSPLIIQKGILNGYGLVCRLLREGRLFKKILSGLEKSQYYSEQELREFQNEKLKWIVRHAYENVPYYRRLFRKLRLSPDDFRDVSDLHKIPFISKSEVKKNPEDFVAINMKKYLLRKVFTGGTTGSPLKIYRDLYCINFENAILRRQQRWAGFSPEQKKVILRSNPIVPSHLKRPPFWRYDYFQKSLFISAYHLSKNNMASYVHKLQSYKAAALETVPSSAFLLAKLAGLKGMEVSFKYIFVSSETILPYQRDFIQNKFGGRLFDHYGTAERVCAMGMCERGTYHIYPEYGILELVPLRGDKNRFEVAGTTLNNFAMPLLRYKTGDVVTPSDRICSCGRRFPVIDSIEGRITDRFFLSSDGRIISLFCSIPAIESKGIVETQLVQEALNRIRVKVVADEGYSSSDELNLKRSVKGYLGGDIEIFIEKVPFIPRTEAGKFRQFISNVRLPHGMDESFYGNSRV